MAGSTHFELCFRHFVLLPNSLCLSCVAVFSDVLVARGVAHLARLFVETNRVRTNRVGSCPGEGGDLPARKALIPSSDNNDSVVQRPSRCMPGTVPKAFDPAIVTSTSDPASSVKAAVSPSDAFSASSSTSPHPLAHPSSGVASLGASTAIANASHTAALSDGNPGAQMTSKSQAKAAAPLPPQDDEKEVALRKFVETSGHFSLVR